MTIDSAIIVFARGFSFTRSRTKPAEVAHIESMTIMRDVRHERPDARNQELIFGNESPENAARILAEYAAPKHKLCWIVPPEVSDEDACRQVKALGYRLMAREGFFAFDHNQPLPIASVDHVRRVVSDEDHRDLAKAHGIKPLPAHWLTGERPKLRRFAVDFAEAPVGWVSSVDTGEDCTWVSALWVNPEHRGKGYGFSLMAKMLADDRSLGYRHSVLLASYAGARLYPHLGYRRIGTLYLASPLKK